jgi:hypothetical protein
MKRKGNTAGLKFKYIQPTNTRAGRYKVTQTNTNKSIFISANFGNKTPLQYFCDILENIESIDSFSLIVDSTQNDYYLFSVDENIFGDLLTFFRAKNN